MAKKTTKKTTKKSATPRRPRTVARKIGPGIAQPDVRGFLRLSGEGQSSLKHLGPLQDLIGTWVGGTGWNVMAIPVGASDFEVVAQPMDETIRFWPVGAAAPNHGGTDEEFVYGLKYEQVVWDSQSNQPLHTETGLWLIPSDSPKQPTPPKGSQVSRLMSVPHGNTVLMTGPWATVKGGPIIDDNESSLPHPPGKPKATVPGTTEKYKAKENSFQKDFPGANIIKINKNLSATLKAQKQAGQSVVETTALLVNTAPDGGITNFPFITNHTDTTKMTSIFWIEKMRNKDGSMFMQLQYTQNISLEFHGLVWPHMDVNTLVKQ